MKPEDHFSKAKRIENSLKKLDPKEDWESIVELVYGSAIHIIAYICGREVGEHKDSHKNLPSFLDENELNRLATLFRRLDELRHGRWYGKKSNGEISEKAKKILQMIKDYEKER